MARFAFRFGSWHRLLGIPFGVTPQTAMVEVVGDRLTARLGPWVVETAVSNVVETEMTGPFSVLKTAGPARLSLADRGLTMGTNADSGLCLRFRTPVRGLDPFGRITHPGLTVTVAHPAELRRALVGDEDERGDAVEEGVAGESPWSLAGRWLRWPAGMALATTRYVRSTGSVQRTSETRSGRPPSLAGETTDEDAQPLDAGVGPVFERVYEITVVGCDLGPEAVIDRLASDLNAVAPVEVAEFVDRTSGDGDTRIGAEYTVRMPGPWDARVRCVDRTPRSFLLATMDGHMEAGHVEFSAEWAADDTEGADRPLVFRIRSVARSGDRAFQVLYDALSVAAHMQAHMWVHLCRRVPAVAGGRRDGPVRVRTIRHAG